MFWFVLFLLLLGAGFFFYQKLKEVEAEIRDLQDPVEEEQPPTAVSPPVAAPAPTEPVAAASPAAEPVPTSEVVEPEAPAAAETLSAQPQGGSPLQEQIRAAVEREPGIKQTDLYQQFSAMNKKHLQQQVKALADAGQLKREKSGSTFLLYPA